MESRVVAVEGLWEDNLAKGQRDAAYEKLVDCCAAFGRICDMVLPQKGSAAFVQFCGVAVAKKAVASLDGGKDGWKAYLVPEARFSEMRDTDLLVTTDAFELD